MKFYTVNAGLSKGLNQPERLWLGVVQKSLILLATNENQTTNGDYGITVISKIMKLILALTLLAPSLPIETHTVPATGTSASFHQGNFISTFQENRSFKSPGYVNLRNSKGS